MASGNPGAVHILSAQAFEHDPDLVFSRKMSPGCTPNILHDTLGRGLWLADMFWSHLRSFVTTMRPKHSLTHNIKSVPLVLTGNKRYHYYAEPSEGLSTGRKAQRMPAGEIDGLVMAQLKARMQHAAQESGNLASSTSSTSSYPSDRALVLAFVKKVIVSPDDVRIQFGAIHDQPASEVTIPAKLYRRGNEMKLVVPPEHDDHVQHQDPALIQFVVRAYMARTALEHSSDITIEDLAKRQGYSRDYYAVLLRIGHLAPDIIAAILNGRQPAALNRQRLARIAALPLDWQGQRAALGFG